MKRKAKLAGGKLQLALRCVAEQDRKEEELAVFLGIKLATLKEVLADPYFTRRVERERETLRLEKEIHARFPFLRSKSGSPEAS